MPRASPLRFRDDRRTLWHFGDEVLVVCPGCGGIARVVRQPGTVPVERRFFGPRRLVCPSCGFARDHAGYTARFPGNCRTAVADPFFGVPLWLQLPTRHGVLWAYNLEHVTFIERFVAAHIRERADFYDTRRRMTLIAKLPAWLKHAGNRDENLRNLARLRESALSRRPPARIRGSLPRPPRSR